MKEQLAHKDTHSLYFEVAPHVWGTKDIFVNMYMVQNPEDSSWVLIDAGLKSSAPKIKKMAAELFGANSRPNAILLTHGHFDHVGSLKKLADEWDVPVYVHYLELPYLSGRSSYPPPDPKVGGGLMSQISWMYPKKPINVESRLHILPPDGRVPFLPGWVYINTPGHAPGHVSYFRQRDKVLIAGDAIVTTNAESVMSVMLQKKKLSGPPKYFTYDWNAARISVKNLSELEPAIVASGHGQPLSGDQMRIDLTNLAVHFNELAIPEKGRYVDDPAVADASGFKYIPPKPRDNIIAYLAIGLGLIVAAGVYLLASKHKKPKSFWKRLRDEYLPKKLRDA
ncbi:MBL fold metallo-hydrolase [Polluticoccus soli]|uniref:MBL fold metallo-hydrolase n=1 Tax=Polluticoccus soli TaxID=3034150 RepID=UPI0023E15502|nr:MBL fold metallo-hydrolase [Flavipsychrobacter sp. JY13-12]